MPLRLPQLSFAIKCEGNELEMFDVKQEDPSSMTAFVASEAGKVGAFSLRKKPADELRANADDGDQQFRVTFVNNLVDCDLSLHLLIDGETVRKTYVRAQEYSHVVGIHKGPTSVLPFKFQELELVGAFAHTCLALWWKALIFATDRRPRRGRCPRRARNGDDRTSSLSHPGFAHGRLPAQ